MARQGTFKIKGMKKVMNNLHREISAIRGRTLRGLIEAAIVVQRAAEPGTPVDLNNLRASWFIVTYKADGNKGTITASFKGKGATEIAAHHKQVMDQTSQIAAMAGGDAIPVVVMGYSANYAAFVHENVEANFQRPSAKARWFYLALAQSEQEILEVIRQYAKVE